MPDAAPTGRRARRRAGGEVGQCRVAYVVKSYPAVSHSFIQREVREIRASGGEVMTLSLQRAGPEDILSAEDEAAARTTDFVRPIRLRRLLGSHARAMSASPSGYLRTLAYAFSQSPPGLRSRLWQLFYFGQAIVIWAMARRRGARHLHAHLANVATDAAWLATHFGRLAEPEVGWRWSFTMHGPTEFFAVERFNLARKVANAGLVICISEFCRSQLMSLCRPEDWAKLLVVHCGADLERYHFTSRQRRPEEPLRVLSVGRLVSEKGHALLLEALRLLGERGIDVTATIVGGGPQREELISLAVRLGLDRRVQFMGPLGQDALPALFVEHDVFCLPSFAEGIPVVFMEAMATGRPVVATRITGVPELVKDGESGLLVSPGRADSIADALELLAASPETAEKMGRAGRTVVETEFDARRCAQLLHGVFTEFEAV